MAAVTGVSASSLTIKAATTHTSPTFLKGLIGEIASLKDAQRTLGAKLRDLGVQLAELQRKPAGEPGVADDLRKVRTEIRDLERRRRADVALLAHKQEQLEAIRKGHSPEAIDDDAKRRAVAQAERDSPYERLFTTDLSSLNES